MLDRSGRDLPSHEPCPPRAVESPAPWLETTTQILAGLALLGALKIGLLTSLLAGLLVFELVHVLAPRPSMRVTHRTGKIIIVSLLATLVVVVIGAGILGLISVLADGPDSLAILLRHMAEVIESARPHLPDWAASYVPADPQELKGAPRLGCGRMRASSGWWVRISGGPWSTSLSA